MKTIRLKLLCLGLAALMLAGCSDQNNELQGFIEAEYTYISSTQSGYLTQLAVSRGEKVQEKQLLFVLDPQPEALLLSQAKNNELAAEQELLNLTESQRNTIVNAIKARLEQAQAQLTLAKQTLDRNQKLYERATISKATLDEVVSQYQTALKRVAEVQSNLAEAELGARKHRISAQQATKNAAENLVQERAWALDQKQQYAPFSGYVFDTFYTEGELIPATTAVLALLELNQIKVVFYLPENLLAKTKPGQEITFGCDGCAEPEAAIINYISPQAEYTPPVIYSEKTRKNLVFRVEARILNNTIGKFNPGQPVDVYLRYQ